MKVNVVEENADVAEQLDFGNLEVLDEPMTLPSETVNRKLPPTPTSLEWEQYVMSQFDSTTELWEGLPKVNGLRRVARKLIGPILKSQGSVKQCPTLENGQRSTVEYTIHIHQMFSLEPYEEERFLEYTDAADVWSENTPNLKMARFPVALAGTRAESRTLKKILSLSIATADEVAEAPIEENVVQGFPSENQITRLSLMCEKINIDLLSFIGLGKYKDPYKIPALKIPKMMEVLSEYNRKAVEVDPRVKRPYNPNWRDEIK